MDKKKSEEYVDSFIPFEGNNRREYPEGIVCATEKQHGGEATLILSGEKTAMIDCGMAYSAAETIENIKEILDGRSLDYILISHTHYDHIGALPYIKKAFPEAVVCGSAYGQYVLTRKGALKVIRDLGIYAASQYGTGEEEIITDGMGIDKVLEDGDELDLGGCRIVCLSTKGHTDCAMTYVLEPHSVMFTSESTGICSGPERSEVAILKSYDDSMEALEKCRNYGAKRIVSPHYGIVPQSYNERYWEVFEEKAKEEKDYTVGMWNSGLSPQQMLEKATKEVFEGDRGKEQPYEAFVANAKAVIKMYEQYADPDKKYKPED